MSLCFPPGPLHHHWKPSEGLERHSFRLKSVETAVSNLCTFVYWLTTPQHPPLFDPIRFQAAVNENSSISCLFHNCHSSVWMMDSQENNIEAGLKQLAFVFMRHKENENRSMCVGVALKGSLFHRIEKRVTITAVETREVSFGESLTLSHSPFRWESSFLRPLPNRSVSAWLKGVFVACGRPTLVFRKYKCVIWSVLVYLFWGLGFSILQA